MFSFEVCIDLTAFIFLDSFMLRFRVESSQRNRAIPPRTLVVLDRLRSEAQRTDLVRAPLSSGSSLGLVDGDDLQSELTGGGRGRLLKVANVIADPLTCPHWALGPPLR